MTVFIAVKDPFPESTGVSPRPFVRLSLTSDDPLFPVLPPNVNVTIGGLPALVAGVAGPGFEAVITENASFGVNVRLRADHEFPDNQDVGVHVTVNPGVDEAWKFTIADSRGPELHLVSPAHASDDASTTPTVQFDIVDGNPARSVQQRVLEDEADDGVLSGSQLTCPSIDFRGRTGHLVIVDGTPMFVVSEIGPNIVVVSGSGGGSGLNVQLFRRWGIDVWINTAQIIKSGEVQAGLGWNVTFTQPAADRWRVNAVRTGAPFVDGDLVSVAVRAADDAPDRDNFTDLAFDFRVGDTRPPRVANATPKPGTRGLDTATSTQPQFDVVDTSSGVSLASLDVIVGGVPAITSGVPQAGWLSSTVTPISGGYQVVLVKATAWPSSEVEFEVEASDVAGNVMGRVTWLQHFGVTTKTAAADVAGGQLVSDDVVRVVAFDVSETSFARPEDLGHTGYAADGFWYERGAKDTDVARASWATEASGVNRAARDEFPHSGFVVVTDNSWSILDAQGVMWMRCSSLGSGTLANWSMGGGVGSELADGDFGPDPVVFLAAGPTVIAVDFINDEAWRLNVSGRVVGATNIAGRNSDQAGGSADVTFALSGIVASFENIAGRAWHGVDGDANWVVAGVRDQQMEISAALSDEFKAACVATRGIAGDVNRKTVLLPATGATAWARVRLEIGRLDDVAPCVFAYSQSGSPRVGVCDWLAVLVNLEAAMATLSPSSTPALPAEDVSDIDHVYRRRGDWSLVVGHQTQALILAMTTPVSSTPIVDSLAMADLGFDVITGVNKRITALAVEKSFESGIGHLYAAAVSDAPSAAQKTVRYRHQSPTALGTVQLVTMDTTRRMRAIAALGASDLFSHRFVRASAVIKEA